MPDEIYYSNKAANVLERAVKEINREEWSEAGFKKRIFNRSFKKVIDFDNGVPDFLNALDTEYYALGEEEDLEVSG